MEDYPKKSLWKWVIICVVLNAVLYGLVHYLSYPKYWGYHDDYQNNKITNWETYNNEKYSFEYPSVWNVVTNKYNNNNSLFGPGTKSDSGLGGVEIFSDYSSINEFLEDVAADYTSKNNITIDGIAGIRTRYRGASSGESVVLLRDKKIYNIYINSEKEHDLDLFNQLISTFKFIDQPNQMVDWKTYRNDQYGFEIKYPDDIAFVESNYNLFNISFYYKNNDKEGPIQISATRDGSFVMDDNDIIGEKNIDGVNGKIYFIPTGYNNEQCEQTLVYKKDLIYLFDNNCNQNKNLFDQILSTFKFTK